MYRKGRECEPRKVVNKSRPAIEAAKNERAWDLPSHFLICKWCGPISSGLFHLIAEQCFQRYLETLFCN